MSIINQQDTPVLTPAQKALATLLSINTLGYKQNKNLLNQTMQIVYAGAGYSAQDIFDLLGTDSVKLFEAANLLIQLIQIAEPDFVPPTPPVAITINPDGTVTTNPIVS